MKEILAVVAALIAIAGNVPYLRKVVRREIQPHPFTWFVWSIVSCIVFFGQVQKGAGIGALPTFAAEIFTILIFFAALKYGFSDIKRADVYFLFIALLGLIPWYLTKDPTISVIIAVGIDVVAFIPTLRKTYQNPQSETSILYGANVVRHALSLLSLEAYNIATTLHSIVMLVTNSVMVVLIKRQRTI